MSPTELQRLAELLAGCGCPAEKALEMAAQLNRRARQLADQKGRTHAEALAHLIGLMRQGWAAGDAGVLRDQPAAAPRGGVV